MSYSAFFAVGVCKIVCRILYSMYMLNEYFAHYFAYFCIFELCCILPLSIEIMQ